MIPGRTGLIMCAAVLAIAVTGVAQYAIDWSTVDGGGAMSSTGGAFEVAGTIGQPDASQAQQLTGGTYTLTGGFWAIAVPVCSTFVAPDFDHDCDVDLTDFNQFK